MKFCSTKSPGNLVSARHAVMQGLAADGGLFVPCEIPSLVSSLDELSQETSFAGVSFDVARLFFSDDISNNQLHEIIAGSITFDAPLVVLGDGVAVLELFHGPTLAFKDFAARFMARTMSYFHRDADRELTILVATSGDTGSAVAQGFYNVEGINVVLLYPSGKVSRIQEQQLTTIGGNVTALEVDGTFDDCQAMVKQAFLDTDLNQQLLLSSANSINIARLIPQTFYYIWSAIQAERSGIPLLFSVPSGNFGNLTAGLYAKRIAVKQAAFIAATNINDVVPEYLATGQFRPRPSVRTHANAMDVGNPSNFARMQHLFASDHAAFTQEIHGARYTDDETCAGIREVFDRYDYVIDPHGAIGYLALRDHVAQTSNQGGIVLETAHPAKFSECVESVIEKSVEIPERLAECLTKEKQATQIGAEFDELKAVLRSR